jgi:hypothetical protein
MGYPILKKHITKNESNATTEKGKKPCLPKRKDSKQ